MACVRNRILAKFSDDGKAVDARQHYVEEHDVVDAGLSQAQRLFAVVSQRHRVAFAFECPAQVSGQAAFVLDNQYLHGDDPDCILTVLREFSVNRAPKHRDP